MVASSSSLSSSVVIGGSRRHSLVALCRHIFKERSVAQFRDRLKRLWTETFQQHFGFRIVCVPADFWRWMCSMMADEPPTVQTKQDKKQWRGFESGERMIVWKPWHGARSLETIRGRHCQDNLVCCCFFGGTFRIAELAWILPARRS